MRKVLFLIFFSGVLAGCGKPAEQVRINKDTDDRIYNEYLETKKNIEFICMANREYAQSVMKNRQYKNFTLEEELSPPHFSGSNESVNDELKGILREAYQYPKESSETLKEGRIREFSRKIYSDCYSNEVHKVTN